MRFLGILVPASMCVFCLFVPSPAASGVNAVANPYFRTGTTSWTGAGTNGGAGTVTFSAGSGSPSTGSAQVTLSPSADADDEFEIRQCFSIVGVEPPFDWGGRLRVVSANVSVSAVSLRIFNQANCAGTMVFEQGANDQGPVPGTPGSFVQKATTGTALPAGGVSARIAGAVIGFDSPATGTTLFDSFFFGPAGTVDLLFEDGFESSGTSAWDIAVP